LRISSKSVLEAYKEVSLSECQTRVQLHEKRPCATSGIIVQDQGWVHINVTQILPDLINTWFTVLVYTHPQAGMHDMQTTSRCPKEGNFGWMFIVYYLCNVVSVTFGAGGKANLKMELIFCLYLLVRLKGHNRILTYIISLFLWHGTTMIGWCLVSILSWNTIVRWNCDAWTSVSHKQVMPCHYSKLN